MKKVILFSLVVLLLGALILPTIAAPQPAQAWSGTMTCSPSSLNFRVYAGVPTYLLGFIPLDSGQTLTVTHAGGGIAGWTVSDNAGWLNEDLLLGILSGNGHNDVTVRINTDGLTAGTYTATITFKITTCGTTTITVPVTVDVIEPRVLGPLGIGVDKELLKNVVGDPILEAENEYAGLVTNLLTNPDDMLDMQAIETDGSWDLMLQRGDEIPGIGWAVTGGTISINGVNEEITADGSIMGLSMLMGMMPMPGMPTDIDLGENYLLQFYTSTGNGYVGILLGDLPKLLDLLPALLGSSSEAPAEQDLDAPPDVGLNNGAPTNQPTSNEPSTELLIPLQPIFKLLPSLMPVLSDLLSNETIMAILKPLMGLLPPIMIIMPESMFGELISGFLPS